MSDGDHRTDPWSRDVPAAPPPASFDFASARSRSTARDTDADPSIAARPPGDPHAEPSTGHADDPVRHRRTPSLIAAAAVIALLVGGVALATRTDPGDEADSPQTADTVAVDTSTTTTPALERTTTAPPTTRAPAAPRTTSLPTVPPPAPAWIDGQIMVPERLGRLPDSTELVTLTQDGKVLRINFPSGQTSMFDLDNRRSATTLHLGATNVLIANNQGRGSTLLPLDGEPIDVDIEGSGGLNILGGGPGPDEFLGYVWSSSGRDERLVVIGPDGSIEDIESDVNPWTQGGRTPTGERWISDAGGVYLEAPDGSARRVSPGQLIATSGEKLLARECDEQRQCGWFVIDIGSDERVPAQPPEGFTEWNQPIQLSALSPDGQTLLVAFWNDRDATLLDLATGDQTPATVAISDSSGNATAEWAPDSSGYFTIDTGTITFIDRDTGDSTLLAIEFDDADAFIDLGLRLTVD